MLPLDRSCRSVAALQWRPPRLRTRPRCSVTLVASKRHWRSSRTSVINCLASKCSYWLNLARKCLVAAFQWWPPRLRTRPKCSVTSVIFQRPRMSIVNLFSWFSGLKLPSLELVRDRRTHPPFSPSDHSVLSR